VSNPVVALDGVEIIDVTAVDGGRSLSVAVGSGAHTITLASRGASPTRVVTVVPAGQSMMSVRCKNANEVVSRVVFADHASDAGADHATLSECATELLAHDVEKACLGNVMCELSVPQSGCADTVVVDVLCASPHASVTQM
jgi:hypothetical protein